MTNKNRKNISYIQQKFLSLHLETMMNG